MCEWKECKLGDTIIHKKGFAFKSSSYVQNGILVVRVSDTTSTSIDVSTCKKVSADTAIQYKDYELFENDIVIMTVGSWPDNPKSVVGKVIKVPLAANNALLNQNAVRIRSRNQINQDFLYFRLKERIFSRYIVNNAQGSANQASITLDDIFSFELNLPPLPEQRAIASVLSSLDDKINLLHRQNKTLEAMAETLFRQWFVEEADEGWDFVELGNYVNCFNGVSYKSADLSPSKTAMVTLKSFKRGGGFRLDGFKEYTGKHKEQHIVKQGDLVVAHTDITQEAEVIGNPILVVSDPKYDHLIISMDLVKITSAYNWLSNEFLYVLLKTREFKQYCIGYSNGSTVLHLSKEAVPSFEFYLPPKHKIEDFSKIAKSLIKKNFENIAQIRTLEKLRDTLLPKLMSGEVRVNLEQQEAVV